MELELSVLHMVLERGFLFVHPVHSFCPGQALLAVVADEHLLFQHAAHVLHGWLVIDPVEGAVVRHEGLACGGGYKQIRLDIAHHGSDERVEPVIYRQYYYQSSSAHSHADGAYRRNDVDHIM